MTKKIILLGNYIPDNQKSMALFTSMLFDEYVRQDIDVEVWYPTVIFGKMMKNTFKGLDKWLAYLDKYVLYPVILFLKAFFTNLKEKNVVFHICDHSNAPYIHLLPIKKTVITCHDVLAIRGAFGFKDAYCESSFIGKILQKKILTALQKAAYIVFVSEFTKKQFLNFKEIKNNNLKNYQVIYNGFNACFYPLKKYEIQNIFDKEGVKIKKPYILHVGSSLPRKNRQLLIEMLYLLKDEWKGFVCFAGQGIDFRLKEKIDTYQLQDRVFFIEKPSHELLLAIYNNSEAFIFPSYSEGFGWPVIEAQACGIPVLASSKNPMIEVGGKGALYADSDNAKVFVHLFKQIQNESFKEDLVKKGLDNSKRFELKNMIENYFNFYNQMLNKNE